MAKTDEFSCALEGGRRRATEREPNNELRECLILEKRKPNTRSVASTCSVSALEYKESKKNYLVEIRGE